MNNQNEKLKQVDLNNYPNILSEDNTWYLIDEKAGIWFTKAIPGTEGKSQKDLMELYKRFTFKICLGSTHETFISGLADANTSNIKIDAFLDVVNYVNHPEAFTIVEDMNHILWMCSNMGSRVVMKKIIGTVLFSTNETSYMTQRFERLHDTCHSIQFTICDNNAIMPHTNSVDDLFKRTDEELKDVFCNALYAIYEHYRITNREDTVDSIALQMCKDMDC